MYNCNCCKKTRKLDPHYVYLKKHKHILLSPIEKDEEDLSPLAILCPKCFKNFIYDMVNKNMIKEDIYSDGLLI